MKSMKWVSEELMARDVQDHLRSYTFDRSTLFITQVRLGHVLVTFLGYPRDKDF